MIWKYNVITLHSTRSAILNRRCSAAYATLVYATQSGASPIAEAWCCVAFSLAPPESPPLCDFFMKARPARKCAAARSVLN